MQLAGVATLMKPHLMEGVSILTNVEKRQHVYRFPLNSEDHMALSLVLSLGELMAFLDKVEISYAYNSST